MGNLCIDAFALADKETSLLDVPTIEVALRRNISELWECVLQHSTPESARWELQAEAVAAIKSMIRTVDLPLRSGSGTILLLLPDVAAIDGHAFLHEGRGVAFYLVKRSRSMLYHRVFALHEVLHAIHYSSQPEFAFNTREWKRNTGRQFISEGISTALSAKLLECNLDDSLWADALPMDERDAWMHTCRSARRLLSDLVRDSFDSSVPAGLFEFAPKQSPLKNRGGYWLGAMFVQDLIKEGWTSDDLMTAEYSRMKQLALRWLIYC